MTTKKSTASTVTEKARKVTDQINEEFNDATRAAESMQKSIGDSARDIWLAGLGLFSTLEEEGEKMFTNFVDRGKGLEEKGETLEKRAKERMEAFQSYVNERTDQLSKDFSEKLNSAFPTVLEEKFQSALESFGVSSKNQVNNLQKKVDKLTKAVEDLTKKMDHSGNGKATGKKTTTKA